MNVPEKIYSHMMALETFYASMQMHLKLQETGKLPPAVDFYEVMELLVKESRSRTSGIQDCLRELEAQS